MLGQSHEIRHISFRHFGSPHRATKEITEFRANSTSSPLNQRQSRAKSTVTSSPASVVRTLQYPKNSVTHEIVQTEEESMGSTIKFNNSPSPNKKNYLVKKNLEETSNL